MFSVIRNFQLYRLFTILLAVLVLFFPLRIIRTLVTSTTDQNLFTKPLSYVVFKDNVETSQGGPDQGGPDQRGLIKRGDYLRRVEGQKVTHMECALKAIPAGEGLQIKIQVADAITEFERQVLISADVLRASVQAAPDAARIIAVQPDGASDRAGLQRGDLIISINEQFFAGIMEADQLMRKIKPGDVAVYRVLRRLEPVDCEIRLADFGIPFTMIFNILGAILFFIPGIVLGLFWSHARAARRLSEAFLLFSGFSLIMILNFSGFDTGMRPYVFMMRFTLFLYGLAALIHARWYFPSEREYLTRKKWILITPWLIVALILMVSFFLGNQKTIISISVTGLIALIGFPAIVRFIYRKHKSIRDKKIGHMVRWLDWLILGAASLIVLWSPMQIVFIGLFFAIPVVYMFTVFKYSLFGVQVRFDKNVQYTFFAALSIGLTLLLGGLWFWFLAKLQLDVPQVYVTESTIELVEDNGANQTSMILERMILIALTIFGFWTLKFLYAKMRKVLQKQFHRQGYDYKTAAQQLTEALFNRFNLKSLTISLAGKVSELMEIKNAAVVVFSGEDVIIGERGMALELSEENKHTLINLKQFLKTFHGTFSVDYLDAGLKKLFSRVGILYISPIRSQSDSLGCLLIGSKRAETCLDGEDFNFLKAASSQSAIAIENAMLYNKLASQERMKHELEIARQVQLSSLPGETPMLERFDLSADSVPALEVGGDYFDFLDVHDHKVHLILADVSGKGTSAAFYMSKIQGVFRALASNFLHPRDMFLQANPIIFNSMDKSSFVTALSLELDATTNEAVFSRAGHVGLYHYSSTTGKTIIHQPSGMALGICETKLFSEKLEEERLRFMDRDVFVLISDGLSEAHDGDKNPYGEEPIADLISTLHHLSAREIKDRIMQEIQLFAGNTPQHDDQTLVVVKIKPE